MGIATVREVYAGEESVPFSSLEKGEWFSRRHPRDRSLEACVVTNRTAQEFAAFTPAGMQTGTMSADYRVYKTKVNIHYEWE